MLPEYSELMGIFWENLRYQEENLVLKNPFTSPIKEAINLLPIFYWEQMHTHPTCSCDCIGDFGPHEHTDP